MTIYNFEQYDGGYYATSLLAGAGGTCITHTAMTPLDVIKTKIQLEPARYSENPLTTARLLTQQKVPLFTGGVPTALGYLGQGAGKFGGVEVIKIQLAKFLGDERAYENRTACNLVASAVAETLTDICWLCPFEAIRIRQVNNPGLTMATTVRAVLAEEGPIRGFYSGLGPILFKQVPYTMAKFSVQDVLREKVCPILGVENIEKLSASSFATQVGVALTSGFGAGVAAALVSHPADTLLTLMNKRSSGEGGLGADASATAKFRYHLRSRGIFKICTTALPTRILHVGFLTAGQFLVFDVGLAAMGFSKFHFINPKEPSRDVHLRRHLSTGL